MRPDGTVKVLDLGLATTWGEAASREAVGATITATATDAAVSIGPGTPAYMSPEQARGLRTDRRTDVWAFGCVLYELLTGQRAFGGDRLSDVVARVLERGPDFTRLPAETPDAIRRLLRRCLEKNPEDRLRDLGDARLEIRDTLAPPPDAGRRSPPERHAGVRLWHWWAGAAMVVLVAGILAASRSLLPGSTRDSESVVHVTAVLPPGVSVTRGPGVASSVAMSPDGRTLVIAGADAKGQRLYRRTIDRPDATPLAGTDRRLEPVPLMRRCLGRLLRRRAPEARSG